MREKPEVEPTPEYVNAVLVQVGTFLLAELSKEVRRPVSVAVELFRNETRLQDCGQLGSPGVSGTTPRLGQMRVRFRQPYHPDRKLFFMDCVLEVDSEHMSVSGFHVNGDVKPIDGALIATFDAWTVMRNSYRWAKWF